MPCLRMSDRPTLPSLRALGLPTPKTEYQRHRDESSNDLHDIPSAIMNDYFSQKPHRARQASTSSSQTSRSPSPQSGIWNLPSAYSAVPSNMPAIPAMSPFPSPPPPAISVSSREELRFVPSSLNDAQAVIVVPAPSGEDGASNGRALLIMGQSLQQMRQNPARTMTRGARVHPYRIMRGSRGQTHIL